MPAYRAVIVGLTGIGARRPTESRNLPIYDAMPRSHAAAYYRHPQTQVVAVCDIRQELLDHFKRDWADVWPEVRCYTDYRAMLTEEKPDLVSVCTPDHLHTDITVDAANGGAKAIFCEKPIATTLADADRMIAAAVANNALLSIDHTRRWSPIFLKARDLVRSGEFGSLRGIVGSLYDPRAMLFRNGTHWVDTICFFAEAEPVWVFAELEAGFAHFTEYKSDGGHDPKTDPAVTAYIQFANGVRTVYNSLKVTLPGSHNYFELVCDKASLLVSDRGLSVTRSASYVETSTANIAVDDHIFTYQLGAVAELIRVLEQGGQLVSPAREARKTLEIMLAMLRSHEQGNVRVNLPLNW